MITRRLLLCALFCCGLLLTGCTVRQAGDAGPNESRLGDTTMASPTKGNHDYLDRKKYMQYWP